MRTYLDWEDTSRHYAARGLAAGEDTDVQDCPDCGVLWDALRETHHCRGRRRPVLAEVRTCDCCQGAGEVLAQAVPATPDQLTVEITCPLCAGLGIRLTAKETP